MVEVSLMRFKSLWNYWDQPVEQVRLHKVEDKVSNEDAIFFSMKITLLLLLLFFIEEFLRMIL